MIPDYITKVDSGGELDALKHQTLLLIEELARLASQKEGGKMSIPVYDAQITFVKDGEKFRAVLVSDRHEPMAYELLRRLNNAIGEADAVQCWVDANTGDLLRQHEDEERATAEEEKERGQ